MVSRTLGSPNPRTSSSASTSTAKIELTLHYNRLSNPSTDPAETGQLPFGNDTIFGGDGDDRLFGQFQDDDLFGEVGTDFLFGGDGDNSSRFKER